MNSSGLPCSSPSPVVGPPPGAGVGVAGPAAGGAGAGGGGGAVKLKFCRYYAKDKTCFYGEECQFLHEEPGAAPAGPGPAAPPLGGLPLGIPPPATAAGPGYSAHGASSGPAAAVVGPKKAELGAGGGGGGGGGGGLDGPRLASECFGAARGCGAAGWGVLPGAGGGRRGVPHPRHAAVLPETNNNSHGGGGGPRAARPAAAVPGGRTGLGWLPRGDPARTDGKERAGVCGREFLLCGFKGAPGQLSIRPSSARLGVGSQVFAARSQAGSSEAALSRAVLLDGLFGTACIECRLLEV